MSGSRIADRTFEPWHKPETGQASAPASKFVPESAGGSAAVSNADFLAQFAAKSAPDFPASSASGSAVASIPASASNFTSDLASILPSNLTSSQALVPVSKSLAISSPDALGAHTLSIALIGPDPRRRNALFTALSGWQSCQVQEFSSYPASLDDLPRLMEQLYDTVIIDLDSDSEYALDLIESICAASSTTVMVYSSSPDPELLLRCMRAGAREFLAEPFAPGAVTEALVRASVRRPVMRPVVHEVVAQPKTVGRFMVFLGAKGGSGVTTLACNFSVMLAQESTKRVLLIDLDLPLGGVAIDLGLAAKYSVAEALQNSARLDSSFLSRLLVKHDSGLFVLSAPGKFSSFQPTNEDIDRLLTVAQQEFDYVVVDAGCRFDLSGTELFGKASTVYLVTQVSIPELRNSNLLVTEYFATGTPQLEIVLNRYMPRSLGIDEEHVNRALTRAPRWKIPNDYITARRTQNLATPLALEDSVVSHALRRMARVACGLPEVPEKKTGKKLFTTLFG